MTAYCYHALVLFKKDEKLMKFLYYESTTSALLPEFKECLQGIKGLFEKYLFGFRC